jgi:hypothetical protein
LKSRLSGDTFDECRTGRRCARLARRTWRASTLELADLERQRELDLREQKKLKRAGQPHALGRCWYGGDLCGSCAETSNICQRCTFDKKRRREVYAKRLAAEAEGAETAAPEPDQPRMNSLGEPMEEYWKISEYEARRRDPDYRDPRYD